MTALMQLQGVEVRGSDGALLLKVQELSVRRGETLAVVGSTGAGKSTLLRVMNGLLEPNGGRLLWEGAPVPQPMPLQLRRKMVMAFQAPLLFRGTVADNVAYGLRLRGEPKAQVPQRVRQALELFAVAHLAQRSCAQLSGGEAHRVSLARALVLRPELLLLDEPFASVDAVARERLGAELRAVLRAEGTACVYVTHDQREAQRMADRLAVLEGGTILQEGTPDEVFYRPASEQVARFVQAGNLLPGVVRRSAGGAVELEVSGSTIEAISQLPEGTAVVACLRPEDIAIARCAGPGAQGRKDSVRNHLQGTVTALQAQGPITFLTIACGVRLVAVITRRSAQELGLAPGDAVEASFKATALHVLRRDKLDSGSAPD
jgi:tungstate transport system ATP-binding protein